MESFFGILFFIFLIGLGIWSHKRDIAKYGPITKRDRRNTLLSLFSAFVFCVVLFKLSVSSFLIASLMLYVLFHFASFGEGKRGLFRQIRDGVFVGWVASLPVCIVIWRFGDKT